MPRTEPVASRGDQHDGTVLAVGAVVLVGFLLMGACVAHAETIGSATKPHVKVATSHGGSAGQPSAPVALPTTTTNPQLGGGTGASAVTGSASDDVGSLSQTIAVSIQPGPLTVSPSSEDAMLTSGGRSNGSLFFFGPTYNGQLQRITVVDARGSLVGWRASVTLLSIEGVGPGTAGDHNAEICVTPDDPTMVAGNPLDVVRADQPSCGGIGDDIPVFFAASGGGGGTYSDIGALTLLLPGSGDEPVTAQLAVLVS